MNSNYTDKAKEAIEQAEILSNRLKHSYVGTEHLLAGIMMVQDCAAAAIMTKNEVKLEKVIEMIESLVSPIGNVAVSEREILTPRAQNVLVHSARYAKMTGDTKIGTEHILLAIIHEKDGVATRLLNTMGINLKNIYAEVLEIMGVSAGIFKEEITEAFQDTSSKNGGNSKNQRSALSQFSVDLTENACKGKLDPVIGRENEILRVLQILSRRTKNNPCLVGEPGVGKTAIVEAIAKRIADGNVPDTVRNKRLLTLDLSAMVAGSKYRGEFEERIKRVIEEVKRDGEVLLFLDEIHTIIGAGGAEGSIDAANILKPALARGEIQIIGATTINEYRKYFEKDAALERRFQPVTVEPPTVEESIEILKGLRGKYEEHHKVIIEDSALEAAVNMSDRYINDRYLPDKAIDLMDEAASKVKLSKISSGSKLHALMSEINGLELEKLEAIKRHELKRASEIKDRESKLQKKYDKLASNEGGKANLLHVEENDIAEVVSMWTKIPVAKLTEKESARLKKLENTLSKRVIGQSEAVKVVSNAIRRGRVGLKDPKRPTGSFLFLGPTGVGKTELSKAISESVFGSESAMIRVDMSEYMEKHSVSKIIGSPPGYVGYDDGGQLSERVRRNPYSVILFDEIEKAHPDVFNILLQILDEGHITDNTGRKVDFKNTVIIMTSNVGAQRIIEPKHLGFLSNEDEEKNYETMKSGVMEEIKQLFKPEFINRIDEIIVFHSLQKDEMKQILNLMVKEISDRAKKQLDINIKMSAAAKSVIIEKSFDKKYGARPLRRKLQTMVEDRLAEEILEGNIKQGDTVSIGVSDKKLKFEVI